MTVLTTADFADQLIDAFIAQGIAFTDATAAKAAIVGLFTDWLGGDQALPANLGRQLSAQIGLYDTDVMNRYLYWAVPAAGGPYGDGTFDLTLPDGTVVRQPSLAKFLASTAKGDPGGLVFAFDSGTADADPGSGKLRLNNATLASATRVFVSNLEYGGGSVAAWLDSFDDAAATNKGYLILQEVGSAHFAVLMVNGAVTTSGAYRKLPVAYVAGVGPFTSGARVTTFFTATGTKGDSLLSGHGAPTSGLGQNGDVYLNLDTGDFYGPKTSGAWGSPVLATGLNSLLSQTIAARDTAVTSAGNAATSETNALASKTAAATSATNAGTSESNALASKTAAATSATNAAASESNALASKTAAAASETNAAASEATATSAKTDAVAARDLSLQYRDQARQARDEAQAISGGDFVTHPEVGAPGGVASLDGSGHVPAGQLALTKSSVGLGNADNTADADKPVSTAQAAAIAAKLDASAKATATQAQAQTDNATYITPAGLQVAMIDAACLARFFGRF